MEDADNLPPSKKRVAGREFIRDTPFDDEEEDSPEVEGGTFKRTSDEVLATRRIVKVGRRQTNSAPSSNPFAGIHLVTPTEATAEKQSADEYTATDDSKDPEEEKNQ
ncbi:nuclear pore complex protein NUP50A-like [Arachis duranensis]|uniref:Nuclear pore complex protein NUP50A-like n=1 Tax=Arachis duranensis TaxID=130453 RepID=A0A6P5MRK6_ARADU|nr:nuclear pore complex protein NUP50A-like [Arachis duranensis]